MSRIPYPIRVLVVLIGVSVVAGAVVNTDVIYVDDDAPNDPGPGDSSVSDPAEDGSTDHPFDAIQEGIDAAVDGDEVVVLPGTYTGDGNRDLDNHWKAMTIHGEGGAAATLIDCQGAARGFFFHSFEGSASVLDGFTITNSTGAAIDCEDTTPKITGCTISGNAGWGISAMRGTIANCTVRNNGGGIIATDVQDCTISGNAGWGIYVCGGLIVNCTVRNNGAGIGGPGALVTIQDCTISGNAGAGIELAATAVTNCSVSGNNGTGVRLSVRGTITSCTINGNNGRGVWLPEGGGTIASCTISGNSGDGCFSHAGTSIISNCEITGNAEGLATQEGDLSASNCLIHGNPSGGVACSDRCHVVVTNCTIAANAAAGYAGAYCRNGSTLSLANCILWGNEGAQGGQISVAQGPMGASQVSVWHSDVQGGEGAVHVGERCTLDWGAGNIEALPAFLSAGTGTWTHDGQYDALASVVTLSDNSAEWTEGQLVGKVLNPDASQSLQFVIIANTAHGITILADWNTIEAGASWVTAGATYEVYDYRLLAESPCIDVGDNDALPADSLDIDHDGITDEPVPFDLDGNPRIVNEIVNIGAYEGLHQHFLITGAPVTVPEGGLQSFQVSLGFDPGGTLQVTVAHHSGDADIFVSSGRTLTFDSSNYSTPQPVTLAAAEDLDWTNGTAMIRVTAPDTVPGTVAATEDETDPIPPVVFVDPTAMGANIGTSWEAAFSELSEALGAITNRPGSGEVWVAAGTYIPSTQTDPDDSRTATFQLLTEVAIYGGFPAGGGAWEDRDPAANETILSGDLNGDDGPDFANNTDNSYHVVTGNGVDETAVLDGFTISGGNADGEPPHNYGAGIYIVGGSPTIRKCAVTENMTGNGADYAVWDEERERYNGAPGGNGAGIYCDLGALTLNPYPRLRDSPVLAA